jgi:hypothetical protein
LRKREKVRWGGRSIEIDREKIRKKEKEGRDWDEERKKRENGRVEERESNCGNETKICPTSLLYQWVDPTLLMNRPIL